MKTNTKVSKYSFLETIFELQEVDVATSKCLLSSISNFERRLIEYPISIKCLGVLCNVLLIS